MTDTSISDLEARLAQASASPVDPTERIDALNALAWELRGHDRSRSNKLATEARGLAIEHAYALGQARAARTMGMTFQGSEGAREAFQLAEEAKRKFDEAGDAHGRAASRDYLASLHEFVGDLAGGLALALDALSIARELGDPVRQGYALSSVGGILAASGEVSAAVEHLEEALSLFEKVGDLGGAGTIASRLATVLKSEGRNEEALVYAMRCRDLESSISGADMLSLTALTVMAEVAAERGEVAEAERLYRAALASIGEETARNLLGGAAQIALGRLLMNRGALDEAEHEITDALARSGGETVSMVATAGAHDALSDLFERRGDLAAAMAQLRLARALREKISQQEAHSKLAQIEARAEMDTAKKDAEIHKLRFVELHGMQAKLVEAEKMALLGKLAAGTAHELHTPLAVLRSNAELSATAAERLTALVEGDGEAHARASKLAAVLRSCVQASDSAMERIAEIAENLGRFTQLDRAERRSFDVSEGVESALALLEPTLAGQVVLERRLAKVPAIPAWPRELNHAFMTVLQNAAQAIDGAGVVSAETSATSEHVLVRVRDTGRGMSEEQAAHLFDVAWSDDGQRKSMRLGLSAAYTTMQKHGGTIDVESVLGEGTTVTFRFPIENGTG